MTLYKVKMKWQKLSFQNIKIISIASNAQKLVKKYIHNWLMYKN